MKVMTVLGTRPELIRLSCVIPKLDAACQHILVHTGQNYDPSLYEIFLRDLRLRAPDHALGARGSLGAQLGIIFSGVEELLQREKPDRFLVLGDTNSALTAFLAKRQGIPVFHMEAGNRCYDDRVPEEVNRRVIDHCSDILMPYTERSRANLLKEGIAGERVFVTGNPINEVLRRYAKEIDASPILNRLDLAKGRYLLVTMHRAENVDVDARLSNLIDSLDRIQKQHGLPVVISTHPRTQSRLNAMGRRPENAELRFLPPFGFFDFVALERSAMAVLTDSGTVQEECAILGVPNVTVRDNTERPETIECGSNILSGTEPETVQRCLNLALGRRGGWSAPLEYRVEGVSDTVLNIALGFRTR